MNIQLAFLGAVLGIGFGCGLVFLIWAERHRRLGATLVDELRLAGESDAKGLARAYRLIHVIRKANDDQIRRGMRCLADQEIEALITGHRPIQPRDFVVTERGSPMRFED